MFVCVWEMHRGSEASHGVGSLRRQCAERILADAMYAVLLDRLSCSDPNQKEGREWGETERQGEGEGEGGRNDFEIG